MTTTPEPMDKLGAAAMLAVSGPADDPSAIERIVWRRVIRPDGPARAGCGESRKSGSSGGPDPVMGPAYPTLAATTARWLHPGEAVAQTIAGLDFLCVCDKVRIRGRAFSTAEGPLWPPEPLSRGQRKQPLSNSYKGFGLCDGLRRKEEPALARFWLTPTAATDGGRRTNHRLSRLFVSLRQGDDSGVNHFRHGGPALPV